MAYCLKGFLAMIVMSCVLEFIIIIIIMLFGIVPMFVFKDFVPDCLVAQICANFGAHAHFGVYLRDEAIPNKIL